MVEGGLNIRTKDRLLKLMILDRNQSYWVCISLILRRKKMWKGKKTKKKTPQNCSAKTKNLSCYFVRDIPFWRLVFFTCYMYMLILWPNMSSVCMYVTVWAEEKAFSMCKSELIILLRHLLLHMPQLTVKRVLGL